MLFLQICGSLVITRILFSFIFCYMVSGELQIRILDTSDEHFTSIYLSIFFTSGAKLCMMLDLIGNLGSVTGVDVARHRLAACITMIQKYALGDRCRLFVADGTTFSLIPLMEHSDSKSGGKSGSCITITLRLEQFYCQVLILGNLSAVAFLFVMCYHSGYC